MTRQVIEVPTGVIRGCEAFVVLTERIPSSTSRSSAGSSSARS
jgi:hypothetical protein